MTTEIDLLKSGVELIHQILVEREITEDLRIRLAKWRELVEMVIEDSDEYKEENEE